MINVLPEHAEVFVIVEPQSGIQQNHRDLLAQGADDVSSEALVLGRVGKRRPEIEADRHVVRGRILQRRGCARLVKTPIVGVVVQQADAGLLEPVEAENPVHQRGVKQLGVRRSAFCFRTLEDIHVHLLDAVLLLMPRLVSSAPRWPADIRRA